MLEGRTLASSLQVLDQGGSTCSLRSACPQDLGCVMRSCRKTAF